MGKVTATILSHDDKMSWHPIARAFGVVGLVASLAGVSMPVEAVAGDNSGIMVCLVNIVKAQSVATETAAPSNPVPARPAVPQGDLRLSSLDGSVTTK